VRRRTGVVGNALLFTVTMIALLAAAPSAAPAPRSERASTGARVLSRSMSAAALRPHIADKLIPFGQRRMRQMARYSWRHYGEREYRLRHPRVVVEHYTDGPTMLSAWWTMANNTKNLDESPGVCTHFIVDKDGTIYRTVPLGLRCRHTIGLNQTAIGIEHVGTSDRQVMGDRAQRRASLRLTVWLMARFDIPVKNVIGHGESLLSPYRHERYRSWRCLTHTDFSHRTMHGYRSRLAARARAHGLPVGPRPHWVHLGC